MAGMLVAKRLKKNYLKFFSKIDSFKTKMSTAVSLSALKTYYTHVHNNCFVYR